MRIKNGLWETLPQSTGYLVWRLAVKWRANLDRALAPLGLTSAQYGILASLYGLCRTGAQPSQRELADFVGFEPVFVSTLARALQRGGFVQRRVRATDTRAFRLSLTPRGVRVVTAARKIVVELEEHRLAVLGGHDSARGTAFTQSLLMLLQDPAATAPDPHPSDNRRTGQQRPADRVRMTLRRSRVRRRGRRRRSNRG